jgi:hypothetical protein
MTSAAFLAEVARFNSFVEKKKDADFDCMIFRTPDRPPHRLSMRPGSGLGPSHTWAAS